MATEIDSGQTQTVEANSEIPLDNLPADDTNNNDDQTKKENSSQEFRNGLSWEHGLWLFFFVLSIYNYVTDLLVAKDWSQLRNLCPNFRQIDGHYCEEQSKFEEAGGALLIVTTFGFLFALLSRFYQLYIFYVIWKRCTSEEEKEQFEIKVLRCEMFTGWLPLIIEDIGSLIIVTKAMTESAGQGQVKGIDASLLLQSLAITAVDLLLNYLNFLRVLLWKKRAKIKETFKSRCVPNLCFVYWILMGIALIVVLIVLLSTISNMYESEEDKSGYMTNYTGARAYIEYGTYGQCRIAEHSVLYGEDFYDNPAGSPYVEMPTQISDAPRSRNCSTPEYEIKPLCRAVYDDSGEDAHYLNCSLWYPESLREENCTSSAAHALDSCGHFQIPITTCGTYTLSTCNFTQGYLRWYVCFDHCYLSLDQEY